MGEKEDVTKNLFYAEESKVKASPGKNTLLMLQSLIWPVHRETIIIPVPSTLCQCFFQYSCCILTFTGLLVSTGLPVASIFLFLSPNGHSCIL
jgi:hypothetical protein